MSLLIGCKSNAIFFRVGMRINNNLAKTLGGAGDDLKSSSTQ